MSGALAARVGREHLAVVAAGDDALAVRRRGEDAAAVHRDALLVALARDQQQRLLAEHEGRGVAEEMHADHRRAGRDRPRALDDGGGILRGSVIEETRLLVIPGRARGEPGDTTIALTCRPNENAVACPALAPPE